ncbi:Fungal Zn2-Cys6 binuclear cluster domain-containing protein, partial [Cladophialophora immunda]
GCKACRRRGKRCDEAKPVCRACHRLSLACEYGLDISFRHYNAGQNQAHCSRKTSTLRSAHVSETLSQNKWPHSGSSLSCARTRSTTVPPVAPLVEEDTTGLYFKHFESHVRHVLPGAFRCLVDTKMSSAPIRYAVLCLSASNLAMLDARIQSRHIHKDSRRSVFSPIANRAHHHQARKYHDLAVTCCDSKEAGKDPAGWAMALATKVLLAIYHHASTDHLRFRLAVEDAHQFVHQHRTAFLQSPEGQKALQLWHRLSVSFRTSRRPPLLIEGESDECSQAKFASPSAIEHLYLTCILGMSPDDLIYDILIKTIELRKRAVVFRTVARIHNVSDESQHLGRLAHEHLDMLLHRRSRAEECAEAETGFVRGPHLIGLLQTQQDRLSVWKSRLDRAQLPPELWDCQSSPCDDSSMTGSTDFPTFPTHRDAMNAL